MIIRAKSPAFGRRGMVATSQQVASCAGIDILRAGGSAVDAAIAANAMLSLAEPHMCGPGGDLFAIVWDPRSETLQGLNASGRSAAAMTYAAMKAAVGENAVIPARGPLSVSVPGAVDGWCALHERYGRLPLRDVLAPVIEHARAGVPIGARTAEMWAQAAAGVTQDPLVARLTDTFVATYLRDGVAPGPGSHHANPDLADTYETIAQGRGSFYGGAFGARLADYLQAVGSAISIEDLARSHATWVDPITTRYRGYDVYELPPNGQGLTVLEILNVLESYPIGEWTPGSADYWHAFIEAKKLAFEDRARYYADPAFADVPTHALLDKSYARTRRALVDDRRAGTDYTYGDVAITSGDTTYLTAADGDGMMVSLIQSIFAPFGAGLVAPGTGFGLQCRGAGFALDPDHPNCYAPGKRPFHTIIPAFVMHDGRPWMSFGVMGADMQPQGQVQVLVNMIDHDMDPQAAADAPRMRHFGGSQPNGERLDGLGIVQYEQGIDAGVVEDLKRRGHRMEPVTDWITAFTGGYQAIQYDHERRVYRGGSEPRLDGCALGW